MLVLALDSSATASVALARLGGTEPVQILACRESEDTRSHAEVMAPFTRAVLEQTGLDSQAVDAVLTGVGPGPFTGLRAGIATARTLGFAWDKPVYGLMSLRAIAERALLDGGLDTVPAGANFAVATDARRREIYSAVFTRTGTGYKQVSEPAVGPPGELTNLPVYGYGAGLYGRALGAGSHSVPGFERLQPSAADLVRAAARLGVGNWSEDTQALYLRESDAKVPAAMINRPGK